MKKVIDGTNYQTKTQKLKKTYVDKIVSFLSKKYAGFFKDKNYTLEHLTKDVGKNLPDKDVKTFNMTTSLPKFEKMILEKISKMESKKNVTLKMGNINKLLSHNDNDIKNNSSSSRKSISTGSRSILYKANGLNVMYEFTTAKFTIFFNNFRCFVAEFCAIPLSLSRNE
jgi:hypothetical protein